LLELPGLPSGIRLLSNPEREQLEARFPNAPRSPEDCITCYGTGTFTFWSPEPGGNKQRQAGTYICNCPEQWMLHRYLLHCNVGLWYQRLGWIDADLVETPAVDFISEYLSEARGNVRSGLGLILHGTGTGTGKTLISTLLIKGLLGEGYDCYATTFSEMLDKYTGAWNDPDEKKWFHRRIKNCQVLLIDDIGREYQGRTKGGLPEAALDEVIRHRVAAGTPTFATMNLTLDLLLENYGGNVMSLLRESSNTFEFTGPDRRGDIEKRKQEEKRLGIRRPVVIW
jgi:hypothetical protein